MLTACHCDGERVAVNLVYRALYATKERSGWIVALRAALRELPISALPVGAAGEALLVAEETVDGRQPFCTAGIVAVVVGEVADGTCEDDRQNNDDEIGFHVRSSIREFNLL